MEKFKFFASVNLILIKNGKILLSRRKNTNFFPDHYEGPAGKVDGGETLRQAICRETLEEVGLFIKEEDLSLVHIIHRFSEFGEYFEFYFFTDKYEGQPEIKEPDLCDDVGWFDINYLPENMVPKTKEALDGYKNGKIYSEFGWEF